MNRIDSRDIIDLESRKRDRSMAERLAADLSDAQETIHNLVDILKDCHAAQFSQRSALSIRIAVAIRDHDETWLPAHTFIGKDPAKR